VIADSAADDYFAVSDRIGLRTFAPQDVDVFLEYRNDPEVARLQGWELPYGREQAEAFIRDLEVTPLGTQGEWHQLAVVDLSTGVTVGDVGICVSEADKSRAEIGYTVAHAHQGKGYATEAVRLLLDLAFDKVGVGQVIAHALPDNLPSRRVAEKVGMVLTPQLVEFEGASLVKYVIEG